ncbi:hypothetical protein [Micromonospora chokoriensis]|uniref:hypothetical protein n=1 Tax=Micromonospora chokoriensis TaxID=356851 RepID=UPI0004C3524F|nr:hypothetical protein [Micromonospora chokoriensis]
MTEPAPPPASRIDPDRPRQFAQSGREVDFFLPVVCTDRGQHKRRLLTVARRELDGSGGMSSALEWFAPPMGAEAKPGSMIGKNSYIFRCPSCSRKPQINSVKWWKLVDDAVRAKLPELDLSLLPF